MKSLIVALPKKLHNFPSFSSDIVYTLFILNSVCSVIKLLQSFHASFNAVP